MAKYTC